MGFVLALAFEMMSPPIEGDLSYNAQYCELVVSTVSKLDNSATTAKYRVLAVSPTTTPPTLILYEKVGEGGWYHAVQANPIGEGTKIQIGAKPSHKTEVKHGTYYDLGLASFERSESPMGLEYSIAKSRGVKSSPNLGSTELQPSEFTLVQFYDESCELQTKITDAESAAHLIAHIVGFSTCQLLAVTPAKSPREPGEYNARIKIVRTVDGSDSYTIYGHKTIEVNQIEAELKRKFGCCTVS